MLGMLATYGSSDQLEQLFVCRRLAIRARAEGRDRTESASHRIAKADFGIPEKADL